LEFRYRQAFHNGDLTAIGAMSGDEILPGDTRAYLFANSAFDLVRDYKLSLQLQAVTDPNYMREYGYSDRDRLHTFAQIERVKSNSYGSVRLSHFHSLRASDNNAHLPSVVFEGGTQRRYFPDQLGGELRYDFGFQSAKRYSDTDILGFDVSRVSGSATWERDWVFANGMIADFGVQARADFYRIDQHSGFANEVFNTQAQAKGSLAWPLQRVSAGGAYDLITPKLEFSLIRGTGPTAPNQDSTRVEFDEGNLFAFQRSPGRDLAEDGNHLTLGVDWDRHYANGSKSTLSLGRIWRSANQTQFTTSSGLDGSTSDWMVSAGLQTGSGIDLLGRVLVDDALSVRKAEARMDLTRNDFDVFATFTYLTDDLAESRPQSVSELAMNASYDIDDHWTLMGNFRYDFGADELATAGVGMRFHNECIDVNFSVSRRFETNPGVQSTNDYGLTVQLLGFGSDDGAVRPTKTCGG
ncbi:MAG: LPS assembly protein LptD, partial [Pseudomonadota bacterium]